MFNILFYYMKLKKIHLNKQPVTKQQIVEAIHACYNHICFSTFPYILYKVKNSKQALEQYNSGNCIALSTFIKTYLFNNYHVRSHIVPATVPSIYQVEGTPSICHVALLIPTEGAFYIVDPAFYFLEPMHCTIGPDTNSIDSMNIHEKVIDTIHHHTEKSACPQLLPDTLECVCCYKGKEDDPWSYYTNEVLDPDESIGCHFIRCKPQPFLCKTEMDEGVVKKVYHLKMEGDDFVVLKNNVLVYKGPINKLPRKLEHEIHTKLFKYFSNYLT